LADGFDCGCETAEIFKIEVQEIGGLSKEGLGLSWVAAEDGEFDDS
jgi:hypothetical protein